jgi:MFS family permease
MYLATRAAPVEAPAPRRARMVFDTPRNVVMLGLTSMFTDLSSEMVTSVLPLYFMLSLGFGPIQFGAFDGMYQGLAAVLAVAAAVVADRHQRHKRVAGTGYGLSTVAKFGLVVAAGSWVPTLGFLYLDRLGKGIRTAPRDALISLSSAKSRLGASFGVHRALDTVGAVLGPLAGALILARNPAGFDVVFMTSFLVAVIGLGVLWFFVDERRAGATPAEAQTSGTEAPMAPPEPALVPVEPHGEADLARVASPDPTAQLSWRSAIALWQMGRYRRVCLVATAFALLTPGDALLFLALERRVHLTAAYFPLLYFGASVVFLVSAIPLGRLADRVGRALVFIAGEVLLLGAFAAVGAPTRGAGIVLLMVALLGGYYACTDGVLMALASSMIPEALRTTGLAVLVTAIAIGHLFASIVFGVLWSRLGPSAAVHLFMVGLAAVVIVGGLALLRDDAMPKEPAAGGADGSASEVRR